MEGGREVVSLSYKGGTPLDYQTEYADIVVSTDSVV